jgi:hypothetical protein
MAGERQVLIGDTLLQPVNFGGHRRLQEETEMAVNLKGGFDSDLKVCRDVANRVGTRLNIERGTHSNWSPKQMETLDDIQLALTMLTNCISYIAGEIRDD